MKKLPYKLIIVAGLLISLSACHKVVLEQDHAHPHIKKRHPHEKNITQQGPEMRP